MPEQRIHPLQWLAWIIGLIALGILVYGIIRELFLKSKSPFVYHGLKAVVCFKAFGCSRC